MYSGSNPVSRINMKVNQFILWHEMFHSITFCTHSMLEEAETSRCFILYCSLEGYFLYVGNIPINSESWESEKTGFYQKQF